MSSIRLSLRTNDCKVVFPLRTFRNPFKSAKPRLSVRSNDFRLVLFPTASQNGWISSSSKLDSPLFSITSSRKVLELATSFVYSFKKHPKSRNVTSSTFRWVSCPNVLCSIAIAECVSSISRDVFCNKYSFQAVFAAPSFNLRSFMSRAVRVVFFLRACASARLGLSSSVSSPASLLLIRSALAQCFRIIFMNAASFGFIGGSVLWSLLSSSPSPSPSISSSLSSPPSFLYSPFLILPSFSSWFFSSPISSSSFSSSSSSSNSSSSTSSSGSSETPLSILSFVLTSIPFARASIPDFPGSLPLSESSSKEQSGWANALPRATTPAVEMLQLSSLRVDNDALGRVVRSARVLAPALRTGAFVN
mmetsp:Transcript_4871/g.12144  ORF Transcript_4871/g.12144 Transcript_4871/m.12144 type:complete len:362 (-) Transcript_4871:691-1776(-)